MIKMGDSPSVGYLLSGNSENPEQPGWGGSYTHLEFSARRTYERETTVCGGGICFVSFLQERTPNKAIIIDNSHWEAIGLVNDFIFMNFGVKFFWSAIVIYVNHIGSF
jgi:hypothetical protein